MDTLGILLAAADNDGLVVVSAPPDALLASGYLKPLDGEQGHAFRLTRRGEEFLRESLPRFRRSQEERASESRPSVAGLSGKEPSA